MKRKGNLRRRGCGPGRQRGIGWQESCLCEITASTTAPSHTADSGWAHWPRPPAVLHGSGVGGSAVAKVVDLEMKGGKKAMGDL